MKKSHDLSQEKKIWLVFLICAVMMLGMIGRLVYLMGVPVRLLLPESTGPS